VLAYDYLVSNDGTCKHIKLEAVPQTVASIDGIVLGQLGLKKSGCGEFTELFFYWNNTSD
jgi:hypothetical protein